ncbi:MAG: GAF domain-containing sensor histidine kinase [Calditerrivibrio sp.]|nr:GAF domain-containing sensor histidine kinase [Calditerrivibrio sp.]MCA1932415.1 GAF domain-containing sensor histidine kinase [Calditerrivibrio sp.]
MRKELFDIFTDISEKMASTLNVDELLQDILSITQDYLSVKRVSIMMIEGNYLSIRAAVGLNMDYRDLKIPLGDGISGKVAMSGEAFVMNSSKKNNEELGYSTASYMSVPLKIKSKVVGVLNLTDKKDDFFTDEDVKIATYIASQCAISIEKAQLYDNMRRAENLQLVGKFTSTIAHDIKNLLNIVQSYVELLEIETDNRDDFKEYVDSIYAELKLIHGLVMDILDFSKNSISLRSSKIDLEDFMDYIIKHTLIMLRPYNVEFFYDYPRGVEFSGDRERLFRVFFNLINNALDVVGENGKIGLYVKQDIGKLIFIVEDNGIGIPKDLAERIFDPFYTSGKDKGTGLGLAVVKDIVTAHGGTISVDSEVGKYTKFIITIPIC